MISVNVNTSCCSGLPTSCAKSLKLLGCIFPNLLFYCNFLLAHASPRRQNILSILSLLFFVFYFAQHLHIGAFETSQVIMVFAVEPLQPNWKPDWATDAFFFGNLHRCLRDSDTRNSIAKLLFVLQVVLISHNISNAEYMSASKVLYFTIANTTGF